MVMPCYNKEEYIGEMFDSILAQKWDNIELILVNDGSTDATREIIAEYQPKFQARGFEVVIIDQENAGVCAAAKAGLMRVTGEYVCVVDADDELDPAYVSTMAGWLDEHEDYDYAMCGGLRYVTVEGHKVFSPTGYTTVESGCPNMTEWFLLSKVCAAVWAYMTKREYLEKCHIAENYDTSTKGSHEPGFLVPLTAYGGKIKVFAEPLYYFNITPPVTHSRPVEKAGFYRNFLSYYELCEKAIALLPDGIADPNKKARYLLAALTRFLWHSRSFPLSNDEELFGKYIEMINAYFSLFPRLQRVEADDLPYLVKAVEMAILGCKLEHTPTFAGRIIAWGALGKRGHGLLPHLQGTPLEPNELWDAAGDGVEIKKPDPDSLTTDDLVLVLPINDAADAICAALEKTGCAVMLSDDIAKQISYIKYPQLFKGKTQED
jgi:glycosyltransferase involved in cell wall biosynthesis